MKNCAVSLFPLALLFGCGGDTVVVTSPPSPLSPDLEAPVDTEPPTDAATPLYAVMYEVFDDVGSNSYLNVVDSLDIDAIDGSTSREYGGGRAYLRVYNGWVFIGSPTEPVVTRYTLGNDGQLEEAGEISFANFGLDSGTIDEWAATFISPTKAYLFDTAQGVTILWDPTSMRITGSIEGPDEFTREGLVTSSSSGVLRGNRLYRSLFWRNNDTAEYSGDQLLVVYDVESDQLIDMAAETRCPSPENRAFVDEQGNIYFSNWIWSVAGTLMRDAASNCVLRIPPGSDRFDPDWSLPFAEISGGHEGGVFTYVSQGQGLAAIFDETRTNFDAMTDPWDYAGSGNWQLWSVDLEARSGTPIAGIPHNAGAYTPALVDDRLFVIVPKEGWAEVELYEIQGNQATPGLSIPGWSYGIERIR
jgi:hypothetical protein